MPAERRLTATGVARRYGYRTVLKDVALTLDAGELTLLLGPNGAGKTTLLKVLAGLLRPSAGRVECASPIGLVGHDAMLYDALTALENLRFFARLHRIPLERAERLLERMGLQPRADDRAGTFSRGMIQRLSIARALLAEPGVLLLDEPMTGLDRASTAVVREVLAEQRAGGTAMLVVSHRPEELAGVATAAVELDRGVLRPSEVPRA